MIFFYPSMKEITQYFFSAKVEQWGTRMQQNLAQFSAENFEIFVPSQNPLEGMIESYVHIAAQVKNTSCQ